MPNEPLQFDEHGQPRNRAINAKRLQQRGTNELIGICRGIIADGNVNEDEAKFLLEWLTLHDDVGQEWPGNIIYARIYDFLRDGIIDNDEKRELFEILSSTTGHIHNNTVNLSTSLVFDNPLPIIKIECKTFCLTGRFAFGSRHECEEEIKNLGGWVHEWPKRSTDYLVVGTLASRDWKHASYGQKIEDAMTIKQTSSFLKIVPENHWAESIVKGL